MELSYYLEFTEAGFFHDLTNLTIKLEKCAKNSKDTKSFKAFTESIVILMLLAEDMRERDVTFLYILNQLNRASLQTSQANFILHGRKIHQFVLKINDLVNILFEVYMEKIAGDKSNG